MFEKVLALICLLLLTAEVVGQTEVFHVTFEDITNTTTNELTTNTILSIENEFDRPEAISSPLGSALRLDGHSTYIEKTGFDFNPQIEKQLSIEVWYATECFNQSSVGLIAQQDVNSGFSLKVRPFGEILFQFFADTKTYFIQTEIQVPTYRWNHIVAQVDLEAKKAELHLNGEIVGEKELDLHEEISMAPATQPLFIGRDRIQQQAFGFITSTANGAVDQIVIKNTKLAELEIQNNYNQVASYDTNLEIDPSVRHPDDHLRPKYHFMPNTSWANEAYGFMYYNEKYHVFFQKNPNAPILNFMHWGHLSSPDLVMWKEEKMPLRPQDDFSSVGAWSGTTFFDLEDRPVIAYTGVNGQIAGIGIAESSDPDLIDWEPSTTNPVVERAPISIPNQDFRDPYIWIENDTYYMVVGSGKANNGGGILMSYKSTDYTNWELIEPVFETSLQVGGRFWEMPYFNKLNDEDYLFVVTPQFVGLPAKTIYWIGSFENEKFQPYFDTPKDFELLQRNLLSPAIGLDENGLHSYIGIIPEDRNVDDQIAAGWRQTFSIPRVLRLLDDGKSIGHYPHPNLCRARVNEIVKNTFTVTSETEDNLPEYSGNQSELHFSIYNPSVDKFEIRVLQSESKQLYTAITFNKSAGKLGINRLFSSPFSTAEDHQFRDYTYNSNDSIDVRIFIDHSILEVFVDNLVVLSARVYPGEGSDNIDIIATSQGAFEVTLFEAWDITDKEMLNTPEVCVLDNIPNGLFTTSVNEEYKRQNVNVYPNPSTGTIFLEGLDTNASIRIYDVSGSSYPVLRMGNSIDISMLPVGAYFGEIEDDQQSRFKFVKK